MIPWPFAAKVLVTAVVVVGVSELAKRSTLWGALLASLPLTSLLAFVWLYLDGGSTEQVARLSSDILWLVLPSLVLFALLPVLLHAGLNFWWSLLIACAATAAAYTGTVALIARFAAD